MKTFLLKLLLAMGISSLNAQSVNDLINAYSGNAQWDSQTATLSFLTTGTMEFQERNLLYNNVWYVPVEVEKIKIGANVTLTGEFWCDYDCSISGEDKFTSVVYGTPEQDYLGESRGFCAFYSAPSKERDVVMRISNLTSLNPKVYHAGGSYRGVIHLESCRIIDDRGGRWNNSDGYHSADGGTVKDCYFETRDDAIKAYSNMTIEDTTINMVFFCAPIQCGWGDYGSNKTIVIKNLKLIGNSGRSPDNAIIEARQGNYTKDFIIDGLTVENPNASLFRLQQEVATINVTITNSDFAVQNYGSIVKAGGTRTICGSTDITKSYSCKSLSVEENEGKTFSITNEGEVINVFMPNVLENTKISIFAIHGALIYDRKLTGDKTTIQKTELGGSGIYIAKIRQNGNLLGVKKILVN